MKFVISVLLIMLLGYAAFLYSAETPWWIFVIGAFLGGWVVPLSPFKSLLAGFMAIFMLWLVLCFLADMHNEGILSAKMSTILPLKGSSAALIVVSAFVGGFLAGFASLTGSFMRRRSIG